MSGKILLVDDDIALTDNVVQILEREGFTALVAHTAEDGLEFALQAQPDLALLDIMIPVMGGFELCQQIRNQSHMPIIFLTAMEDVDSIVHGLDIGGDDYLTKPFDEPVLLARIRAQLRRIQRLDQPTAPDKLVFGDGEIMVDLPAHRVTVRGDSIDLTPREFELFAVLVTNAGRVVTKGELIQMAWGPKFNDAKENIKPYIHYLRKKIEADPAAPRWILTARGVGYRFANE